MKPRLVATRGDEPSTVETDLITQDSFDPWLRLEDKRLVSRRDIAAVVFKYLRPMLLIILAAVIGASTYVFMVSPSYTALCKILIKFGREHTPALDLPNQPMASFLISARTQDIFDEVEIMNDPFIMDEITPDLKAYLERPRPLPQPQSILQWVKYTIKTVKHWVGDALAEVWEWTKYPLYELGFIRRLSPEETLRLKFKSALQIRDIKETDVIILGFAWPDPDFAAFAVNTYADAYRRQHLRVHGGGAGSFKFYEAQESRLAQELTQLEKELDDFLVRAGINDLAAEKQATLNFIVELETQQNQSAIEQQEAQGRIRAYERKYASTSEWLTTPSLSGQEASGLAALDNQFVNLITQRNNALRHYEAGARQVRDIDQQITALRDQKLLSLKAYFEDRARTLHEGDLQRQTKITERRAYLGKLRDLSLQYETLQSHRTTLQSELSNYHRKLEELRTTDALNAQDFASVSVLSQATAENALVSPRKGLIIGLAALFGLIFAIAYVLLAEFFNQTFRTEHDVTSVLGIPLIASIPEIRRKEEMTP